ncbi:hypothetical protein BKI52_45225 [marine bacterium AO1-C]|nr:hypothetical protein BKI52_45225 [marine bacterium AO1-C]
MKLHSINRLIILGSLILFFAINVYAQPTHQQKSRFLGGVYHNKNLNIYGLSLGLYSVDDEQRSTNTFGFKLEVPGLGIFLPLGPLSMVAKDSVAFLKKMTKPVSENIYGLSISATGTLCDCKTNGMAIGGIAQYNRQVNGFSLSLFMNNAQKHNGAQFSMTNNSFVLNGSQLGYINKAHQLRGAQFGLVNVSINTIGLQVGVVNYSKKLKGIQIGLWNINAKRQLPFINWDF